MDAIASQIDKSYFESIYAIPRGGLVLGVYLSHRLGLPMVEKPTKRCIICDDIADTGKTVEPYKNYFIVTLYYHKQSTVEPDIWIYEKTDAWIKFPWEVK